MGLKEDVLEHFPQLAWALDIPDIKGVLEKAVAEGWDSARLQAGIQDTPWWKGTEPSRRKFEDRVRTDPAGINEEQRTLQAKLWDVARSTGANLDPQAISDVSRWAIQWGWNEDQMRDEVIRRSRERGYQGPDGNAGIIQSSMSAMQQFARTYHVALDDNTAFSWANQIAAGERKLEDFQPMMTQWAKSRYSYSPEISQAIDKGITPEDFFQPYKQEISKYLEVAPESIDVTNPQWQAMTEVVDPKTGQRRIGSIAEVGKAARQDPRWRTTQNGQAAGSKLVGAMSKMFLGV